MFAVVRRVHCTVYVAGACAGLQGSVWAKRGELPSTTVWAVFHSTCSSSKTAKQPVHYTGTCACSS
jgi:hypothetical protein